MKILLQRVSRAEVRVDGSRVAKIDRGLLLFVGIAQDDDPEVIAPMVEKVANLRIFEDEQGKMNLSALQVGAAILVVSQFTLLADARKGRRPSFIEAAPPDRASAFIDCMVSCFRDMGFEVQTGRFGAHMEVELVNDGPVTIMLDSREILRRQTND